MNPLQTEWTGGVTDTDNPAAHPERLLNIPWTVEQDSSWIDYRCWIEVLLDPGMVLHKALPQVNPAVDRLSLVNIGDANFAAPPIPNGGVNMASNSAAVDVIQRMASSTYRFILRGWGLRVGYQVPIPGIKTIGNLAVVPDATQRAYNVIVDSIMGGIPLWYGAWELPYIVQSCPQRATPTPVAANPALRLSPTSPLPSAVILPDAPADQRATQTPQPDNVNLQQQIIQLRRTSLQGQ